jgi:ADP-ribose pyrophosphatase YjhB (NUDIX family)
LQNKIINWRTSVTVSSIIKQNNKFLFVEEQTRDGILLNQPSGHLEANESPIEASIRETLEETAYTFIPEHFLGVYLCQAPSKKDNMYVTYIRLAFSGVVGKLHNRKLDTGIIATHWLSYEEILNNKQRLRSPLVIQCIDDYTNNKLYDINTVYSDSSIWSIGN